MVCSPNEKKTPKEQERPKRWTIQKRRKATTLPWKQLQGITKEGERKIGEQRSVIWEREKRNA